MKPEILAPALLLGASLLLPPPGTVSRARGFCRDWLALSRPQKQEVLQSAAEREVGFASSCRQGRAGSLAHTLDQECGNWPKLMDFEVRAYVDRLLEPCRREPVSGEG